MPRSLGRLSAALALAAILGPLRAASDVEAEPRPVTAAMGIKTGVIPPVVVAPEFVIHAPHVLLGIFGITTGDQFTFGGELGCEFAKPGESTPYLLGSLLHYEAARSSSGYSEEAEILSITAGYEWKAKHLELQLGAGVLFVLRDQVQRVPCTGWFCEGFKIPPYMPFPSFDLSVRFGF